MNVVFLSPHYPPSYRHFCAALRARGAKVFGLGDVTHGALGSQNVPLAWLEALEAARPPAASASITA